MTFPTTLAGQCGRNANGKDATTWLGTGNKDCCKGSQPCGKGEGDCDQDNDCAGSLVCGENNCGWGMDPGGNLDDCCEEPATISNKRRKRHAENTGEFSTEKLELTFNPARKAEHLQDMEAQRQEAREMYENMDFEKGYRGIFEMLWYSQMPCFDIKDVTSSKNDEHGKGAKEKIMIL